MNKYRKFITTSVGFTFLVVGITGVIFQFFFKTQVLEHIHGWLGVAMVAAAILHILQNWKPLQNHLRDGRVFLLLIPVVAVIALLTFGLGQKEKGGRGEGGRINPRDVMGKLAQAHAADIAKVFGKDVSAVLSKMKTDGLQADSADATVQELAQNNHKSPEGILVYFIK